MLNKIKTGISGLDAMLYGGIPEGNQVVVAGGPGAGKTLLSFEFLYRNAKMGEPGVFFVLGEDPERVIENAVSAFPEFTEIDALIKSKKLVIEGTGTYKKLHNSDSTTYELGSVFSDLQNIITNAKATRLVIDSVSLLNILLHDQIAYRGAMLDLITTLRKLNVTSFLTVEVETPERSKLAFKPEFFIFDGIVIMYQTGEEEKRSLAMEVIKMRGTKHSLVTTPYEITSAGFKVFSAEDAGLY